MCSVFVVNVDLGDTALVTRARRREFLCEKAPSVITELLTADRLIYGNPNTLGVDTTMSFS
jgi:hypothetical protein